MKKMRKAAIALALAYLMTSATLPAKVKAAELTIVRPTVNYRVDPIGIDAEGIRFGWQLQSNIIGREQTAYQIDVSQSGSLVWSSGKVESGLSVGIPYEGPELESASRYSWTVTVWDENGDAYESDESYFETAALGDPAWESAEFIRMPESSAAPIFRTEKEIEGEVISARLYITAIGVYSAQVGGQQVYKTEGEEKVYHHMNPGYGNGDSSIEYETYDVTEMLQGQSSAVVTITAGTGWNNGRDGVLGNTSGRPAVKAMLVIKTDKGFQRIVTNTADWKATLSGPVTANGVYYGEDYDARRLEALGAYQLPGYDDSAWEGAADSGETPYILENSFPEVTAKYLRLSVSEVGPANANDRESRLQIMEVEAIDAAGKNRAPEAKASASDTFNYGDQWRLANINDGDYGVTSDHGYTSNILSTTGAASFRPASPLTVDLEFPEAVSLNTVRIGCRTQSVSVSSGLCANYPKTYSILVSDDGRNWRTVLDCSAGNVRNTVLYSQGLTTAEYAGELRPSRGLSGRIVDEFEQRPVSAVLYTREKAGSIYPGGEIDVEAEYSGADMFKDGITIKNGQTMVVNMGQNLTAIPEIKFSADSGVRLNMKFAEMLNDGSSVGNGATQASGPKGSIYTKSLRGARSEAEYTFAGKGEEVYQPSMSFFGYQYVQLKAIGGDVTVTGLRSRALSSISRQTGFIETNNEDVNRLFLNAVYGQLSNFFTIPTDCPQRDERLAWTGDAQAFAATAMYNFDSAAFLSAYQELLSDNTLRDGYPAAVLSLSGYFKHWATGWSDVEVINAYAWYKQTGDKQFLRDNWKAMGAYMDFLKKNERATYQAPAVQTRAYGDWLAFQGTSYTVIADYYYGYVTSLMAELAGEIGDSEKAAYYGEYFENQKQAFLRSHVIYSDPDSYAPAEILPVPTIASPGVSNVISAKFEPTAARYVRIVTDESGPGTSDDSEYRLQMMELEIKGDSGINYAAGRAASSDNDFNNYGWTAANLTDGDHNAGYSSNNNRTNDLSNSPITVTVDLGEEREISRADIYCRIKAESMKYGVCPNYPRHFYVEASVDGEAWSRVGEYAACGGEERSLTVKSSEGGYNGLFMADAGKAGVIEDNSQTSLIWMLKLGWYADEAMKAEAIDMLVENIRNENPDPGSVRARYDKNTLAVGFLGSNVITPVLSDVGRADVSYDLLLNDSMPSWLFEVKSGATTIWERWNSYDPENGFGDAEMNSFNHFAYGSVAEWMYRYMAGIEQGSGFRSFILQPVTDRGEQYNSEERIRSVNGIYDSYYGRIESQWEADGNGELAYYRAVVPANTDATLYLPVSAESMEGFENIPGVNYLGMEEHGGILTAKITLKSGGYEFSVEGDKVVASMAEGYVERSEFHWTNLKPEIFAVKDIRKDGDDISVSYRAAKNVRLIAAEYEGDALTSAKTYVLTVGEESVIIPDAAGKRLFIWEEGTLIPLVRIS